MNNDIDWSVNKKGKMILEKYLIWPLLQIGTFFANIAPYYQEYKKISNTTICTHFD